MGCFSFCCGEDRVRQASDRVFIHFDRNGSGTLDHTELRGAINQVTNQLGVSTPDFVVSRCLAHYDEDQSGQVDKDEFYAIVLTIKRFSGCLIVAGAIAAAVYFWHKQRQKKAASDATN
eukprot:TRINITY_DN12157_c0_g2_i1.p1 TRINITY_DN12157_c0_g2~~TRINITY_DN12157_c0_g2_i1.p1  ORF type:complete len:119 (-),score=12.70 TRINITY_DN12157_c0_g2_i1:96-452(-)